LCKDKTLDKKKKYENSVEHRGNSVAPATLFVISYQLMARFVIAKVNVKCVWIFIKE
jgi:hypothetical protein